MRVLISTIPGDSHAHTVAWALRQRDHEPILLYPLDLCDGARWSFDPYALMLKVSHRSQSSTIAINELDVAWFRRIPSIFPLKHIQDVKERAAGETEITNLVSGVFKAIERHVFAINPMYADIAASRKTHQLGLATSLNMRIPHSLVSNDRQEIAAFFQRSGGRMIYKPLRAFSWLREDQNRGYAPTTEIVDLSALDGADFQASPGIYQNVIERRLEIRATIMGRRVLAWSKRPADGETFEDVDWRLQGNHKSCYEMHTLPTEVVERCFEMMKALGIVFGCFDFALTPEGEYVFFEVNPAGQFLWGDQLNLGLNHLDSIVRFMESRDPNFACHPNAPLATVDSFLSSIDYGQYLRAEADQHWGNFVGFFFQNVSIDF